MKIGKVNNGERGLNTLLYFLSVFIFIFICWWYIYYETTNVIFMYIIAIAYIYFGAIVLFGTISSVAYLMYKIGFPVPFNPDSHIVFRRFIIRGLKNGKQ